MSALPPKADIERVLAHVRFGPKADNPQYPISRKSQTALEDAHG